MPAELDVDPILDKIKRIHPGDRAKLSPFIEKLLTMIDSYLDENRPLDDEKLMEFAEQLEKINNTSYYVYNELRARTKFPNLFDKALSLLRWRRLNKRFGGRFPRMK